MFGLFKSAETKAKEALPAEIVISHGKIHGLTKLKKRGFIQDNVSGQSIFFNSAACTDFDKLSLGESVEYTSEIDPRDPLRVHAVDIHIV